MDFAYRTYSNEGLSHAADELADPTTPEQRAELDAVMDEMERRLPPTIRLQVDRAQAVFADWSLIALVASQRESDAVASGAQNAVALIEQKNPAHCGRMVSQPDWTTGKATLPELVLGLDDAAHLPAILRLLAQAWPGEQGSDRLSVLLMARSLAKAFGLTSHAQIIFAIEVADAVHERLCQCLSGTSQTA